MKSLLITFLWLFSLGLLLSSCVVTETTRTLPDGTVEKTVIKAPDAATVAAVANTVQLFSPKPTIHYSK